MWITSLAHAKCLFKMIFGHNCFIRVPIFKLFVTLSRTHDLLKDGIVIFLLWCFRKVRFRKMQFLKDGVQTVALSQEGSYPGKFQQERKATSTTERQAQQTAV